MIALDTNVMLYALVSSFPLHDRTATWLRNQEAPLVTTHTNVAEVLRLTTHAKVFPNPLALGAAVNLVNEFLSAFDMEVVGDEDTWWKRLAHEGFPAPTIRGNEVFDARIALSLRYHGVTRICTLDSDFRKFDFLEIIEP